MTTELQEAIAAAEKVLSSPYGTATLSRRAIEILLSAVKQKGMS